MPHAPCPNKKTQNLGKFRARCALSALRYLPGTDSGPKVKAVKPTTEISRHNEILLKKQKPQSSLCGSPGGFHVETQFTAGEPP